MAINLDSQQQQVVGIFWLVDGRPIIEALDAWKALP
jgi:hypothetical protein